MKNKIEKDSIDCIVTSPPYWDCRAYGEKPKKDGNIAKWLYASRGKRLEGEIGNGCSLQTYIDDLSKVFELCYQVLRNNKFMFINIGNRRSNFEFIDVSHKIIEEAKSKGFFHRDTVIWIKQNPMPPGRHKEYYLSMGWEYVLVFTKGKPKRINYENYMKIENQHECKKCNAKNIDVRDITPNYFYSNIGCFGRKRRPIKSHPALFPMEVPIFCLSIATYDNDVILDPFVGSGTTLIAGLEKGLNVIGCELVPEIYNNVVKEMKSMGWHK